MSEYQEEIALVYDLLEFAQYVRAEKEIRIMLGRYNQNMHLLYLLAYVDFQLGRYPECEKRLRWLIKHDPQHPGPRYQLFRLREKMGAHAEAELMMRRMIADFPEHVCFVSEYAHMLLAQGSLGRANNLALEALNREPENTVGRLVHLVYECLETENGPETPHIRAELKQIVAENPEHHSSLLGLGLTLQAQGPSPQAIRIWQLLHEVAPNDEAVKETLIDLQLKGHPLALPLWPVYQLGLWHSMAFVAFGITVLIALQSLIPSLMPISIAALLTIYAVYVVGYAPTFKYLARSRV